MWLWVVVWCAAVAAAAARCNLNFDGDTYRRETLISDVEYPTGLAVDFTSNLLYFSAIRNGEWFSATLDLKSRELTEVKGLTGLCQFAVDQVLQQIHAGCRGDEEGHGGGLYQFDSNVEQFEPTGEMGHRIEYIYYKEMLYYTISYTELLHTFRKGRSSRERKLPLEVYGLAIDKDRNWTFYNASGVYRLRAGATEATRYLGFGHPHGLAINASGAAYVCDWGANTRALFRLNERSSMATRLLDIDRCNDLTFDADNNIIYGQDAFNSKGIFRLLKC